MKPGIIRSGEIAPDFELTDIHGRDIRLSTYRGRPVVLAFLRGFMWPYCRAQLARMRDGYSEFTRRGVEILAIGPDDSLTFKRYWENENIPYVGLPDPGHKVANVYKQEVKIMKLGRMPLICVVDANAHIRYAHYGASMSDIPDNETLLNVIDELIVASS